MSRHRDPILEHQRQKREQAVELGIRGWGCNMKQPHTETAEGEKSMSRNEVKGTHDLHYRLSWRLWPTEKEEEELSEAVTAPSKEELPAAADSGNIVGRRGQTRQPLR
jgi:hypothetical protein